MSESKIIPPEPQSDKRHAGQQITLEQLKQLAQLQQMQAQTQTKPQKANTALQKRLLDIIQNMVTFLDQAIDFIIKQDNPDRNEVVQTARAPVLFGAYVIIIFVVIGGIWSGIAPLNSATVARGFLVSDSSKRMINHQEGGIIKYIFVKQGDKVQAGDKLLEFEDVRIRSQYDNILNQYRTFLANESRLIAERDGLSIVEFPKFLTQDAEVPLVAKIMHTQEKLFKSKLEVYAAEQKALEQKIEQSKKQIEGLEAQKVAGLKNLAVISEKVRATSILLEKHFVQKAALLELESREAEAKSRIALVDSEIARNQQEIVKDEIAIINMQNKYSNETLKELKDTQMQVIDAHEKLLNLKDALDRAIIRSPVDGIVNALNYRTVGSVIHPGSQVPIFEISPENDALIIEAMVPPKNIDSVYVGLVAKIKFSAFKSRTTPLFTGKVISISPDVVRDPQRHPQRGEEDGVYVAKILVDMEHFNKIASAKKLVLHPGMQVEVQIVTGTRTLLKYLLDPVLDLMFKSFKEK